MGSSKGGNLLKFTQFHPNLHPPFNSGDSRNPSKGGVTRVSAGIVQPLCLAWLIDFIAVELISEMYLYN